MPGIEWENVESYKANLPQRWEVEDLLPAPQGSSSSTLGCGGDVSQRNLILQPLIPPARHVLAFSAQTIFKKD